MCSSDILPGVNGGASHARTAMRWVGNLGVPVRRTGGSATPPVLLSGVQDGHDDVELRGLFSVGLLSTGLLFDEANTESTASLWTAESRIASRLGPTPDRTCVGHSNLPILLFEDDEGRCIPALNGEALAPCTAAINRDRSIQDLILSRQFDDGSRREWTPPARRLAGTWLPLRRPSSLPKRPSDDRRTRDHPRRKAHKREPSMGEWTRSGG